MPTSTAGLLRFYEEETFGIKVKPEIIIAIVIAFIIIVSLAPYLAGLFG
ncbi:preprotein translocase subunit Sec61beta [Candidatus Bathyarchaeota archaeon]|nr:MAG: preprotein translocase subunit Sec61beta [Candidatus Bathyarchaeota archaeon]